MADIYKQCVSFIRTAKAKKKQAEMFVFQIDAMLEMHNIAKNSGELLTSMSSVMNTLGKISIDRSVLMSTQRDFQKAQMELGKQNSTIDNALSNMSMTIDNSEALEDISDDDIESEINSYMSGNAAGSSPGGTSTTKSGMDSDMKRLEDLLRNQN